MITLISLHNETALHGFDLTYAIVRSYHPNCSSDVIFQMADLAPSWELYKWYLKQKEAGRWCKELFEEQYVPRFVAELINPGATKGLNKLFSLSKENSIAVGCYCFKEDTCHRSIVGGILLGAGADVRCPKEYIKYHAMYVEALMRRGEPLPKLY